MGQNGSMQENFEHAAALHQAGRTQEAARAYEAILASEPGNLNALIYFGALRLGEGRPGEAEALLRRAVERAPQSAEALANLAAALQALGQFDAAVRNYERALHVRPDLIDARFGLAACLQALNRPKDAAACYQAILSTDPSHPEALYGQATLFAQLGRCDEAIAAHRAALEADPDFAEAAAGLGRLLVNSDAPAEAIGLYRRALDVDPDYVEARIGLASGLARFDRHQEAAEQFRAALKIEPDNADARTGLGNLLDGRQLHAEAIEQYQAVLAHNPDQVDALGGMANVLKNTGRHTEALAAARHVVALRPNFAPAAGLLGSILAEIGEMDEAQKELRRSIALAPGRPETLYHLALLAKVRPGDGTVDALEAALARVDTLPPRDQCLLYFALAKALDDVGERDRGFDHLLRGNAIKRAQNPYAEAGTLGAMRRIPTVFTAEFLAARQGQGHSSSSPVFIVGMPRSGTTLVEQVLASHHAVFGAGERNDLSRLVQQMSAERIGAAGYPEAVWTLSGQQLYRMGADYFGGLQRLAPEAGRITDKMPGNFLFVGLIHLILPHARIIHTRRNPVDTCLSCFSKLFAGEQAFSYDLAELGRYYRGYERLMAHWRTVLPADVFLDVDYEAMVDDFENQSRRIVAHCGLDWDPACLEFYKTSRPVHTASMTQVRQPIYRGSVGRWRPQEALLRPLLDALEER
jgi:tetratricopeptide (TPR) repeat protein